MDNFVHEACVASSVAERLGTLLLGEENDGDLVAGDVPVEFRIYPVGGSMDWHKDVALYSKPQFEIVFTVTNTSDSTTEWEDERTGMRYGRLDGAQLCYRRPSGRRAAPGHRGDSRGEIDSQVCSHADARKDGRFLR